MLTAQELTGAPLIRFSTLHHYWEYCLPGPAAAANYNDDLHLDDFMENESC